MGLAGVGAFVDDFGCGVLGDGVVEPVLHVLVKGAHDGRVLVVVGADFLEHLADLHVEAFLAGADVADTLEQFVEVVLAERSPVLEHVVVQGEPLDDVFPEHAGGPDAELGGLLAVDTVADRYDRIEIVEGDGASDVATAFLSN